MKRFSFGPVATIAIGAGLLALSLSSVAFGGALAITMCHSASACIGGENTGVGSGVRATSTNSYGVFGMTQNGAAGVYGKSVKGSGLSGKSGTGVGVLGISDSDYGLQGQSTSGDALVAEALGGGTGAYVSSATGYGIYAAAGGSDVLFADATGSNNAVQASAGTGIAVEMTNSTGSANPSAYMVNSNGNGTDSQGSYIGVIGRAPASGGYPLTLTDTSANDVFYVDGVGDVSYEGSLTHFSITRHRHSIRTFAATNVTPSLETTGSGTLVNGIATIAFDPAFADTIDGAHYHVMLTPDGDTRGLFVARKDPGGFVVREVQGGRGSFAFDYHVYATDMSVNSTVALRAPHAPVVHASPAKRPAVPRRP